MTAVLITGVGSGVALSIVKALLEANRSYDRGYRIIGVDSSWRAGPLYVLDEGHLVPRCDAHDYIPRLCEICRDAHVDYLIPGTDTELNTLSRHRQHLEAETNAHVIINPPATIEAGFDKLGTVRFLEENGFPFPVTQLVDRESDHDTDLRFPYVLKPRFGSGSVGLSVVRTAEERTRHLSIFPAEMIAQELIDGDEYTCGLAFGADGKLLRTIVLERILKKGFTQYASVVDVPLVKNAIEAISDRLPGRGAYNVQGRLRNREFIIFEINPRFSGTTAFRAVAGQNEPDLYIQDHLGRDLPSLQEQRLGLCMARYLGEIYFDNTAINQLVSHGKTRTSGFVRGLDD